MACHPHQVRGVFVCWPAHNFDIKSFSLRPNPKVKATEILNHQEKFSGFPNFGGAEIQAFDLNAIQITVESLEFEDLSSDGALSQFWELILPICPYSCPRFDSCSAYADEQQMPFAPIVSFFTFFGVTCIWQHFLAVVSLSFLNFVLMESQRRKCAQESENVAPRKYFRRRHCSQRPRIKVKLLRSRRFSYFKQEISRPQRKVFVMLFKGDRKHKIVSVLVIAKKCRTWTFCITVRLIDVNGCVAASESSCAFIGRVRRKQLTWITFVSYSLSCFILLPKIQFRECLVKKKYI